MSKDDLLGSLPSFNSSNFSNFQPQASNKRDAKKLSVYISTDERPPQQVIRKDRSNILLRYLYQQLDKKNKSGPGEVPKRKQMATNTAAASTAPVEPSEDEPRRKVTKTDNSTSSSSSSGNNRPNWE